MSKERIEELTKTRAELTENNKQLRQNTSRYKRRIKELESMIQAEKWDIQRTNNIINENTEKCIQAGRELKTLLNEQNR